MLATASIGLYVLLNVLVTITNKIIIQITFSPYLLTASHATSSLLSTSLITHFQPTAPRSRFASTHHVKLILFSALFTINITFSNFTLGLVSLPVHQTIRALGPVLTILLSAVLQVKTWNSYNTGTYVSLIPIVGGVIVATFSQDWRASCFGLFMTFLGAVTAVIKTIATHSLQHDLGIKSYELIRITSPLAVVQSLTAAWYHSEFSTIGNHVLHGHQQVGRVSSYMALVSLVFLNALLAAALNLASFEANRKCGALSMGVAANLKQVAILFVPGGPKLGIGTTPGLNVVIGSLMTACGGLWYTTALARQAEEKRRGATSEMVERKQLDSV